MTLRAVTYYQVECDHHGCKEQPNDEYSAWSDASYALDDAIENAEWSNNDEGLHWCPKHRPSCAPGQHLRKDPADPCRMCRQWPEDD
ncbi:MAG TPA: hypothetical protein VIY48_03925 [Candidatus Paceibacterota bacterium]